MRNIYLVLLLVCLWSATGMYAQPPQLYFRQLTVADGLNDGQVMSICQDKYGYMWFGTLGGLNRYDGYQVKVFSHVSGDSTSPFGSNILCMTAGKDGRLWIGFQDGMMEFDYKTSKFRKVHSLGNTQVNQMLAYSTGEIYLATNQGLAMLNPNTGAVIFYGHQPDTSQAQLLNRFMSNMSQVGHKLFVGARGAVAAFDMRSKKASKIEVPELMNDRVVAICADEEENLFLATYGVNQLMMLPKGAAHASLYNSAVYTLPGALTNNIAGIHRDSHNNIWVLTAVDGLMLWKPSERTFQKYLYQPGVPGSPSSNQHYGFCEDKEGIVWLGCSHGVNYFNPSKSMFSSIMPFADSLDTRSRRLARGMVEDADGNMWFGTADGVSRYEPSSNKYTNWRNKVGYTHEVYYNSIRSVTMDGNRDIWVITGSGINKFNKRTGKMDFIDPKLFPRGFYFSANSDKAGRTWFGTRDYDGFYWYDPRDSSYHGLSEHPVWSQVKNMGGRYFFEDSKGRYWFGFNGNGVAMFDTATRKLQRWTTSDSVPSVIGDIVVDIKEDKRGVIWVSTMKGITGIDVEKKEFTSFNSKNGLLSNSASALAVDALNRLWIATPRGLTVLDSSRKLFTSFSSKDGLPVNEFPEYPGYVLRNGDFIFPSFNGYVRFNPLAYKNEKISLPCYISSYSIFNETHEMPEDYPADTTIRLKAGENFFSILLSAVYLNNPSRVWYAYKLDGLDKDWHYTQDRKAVYTNVPGGNYTFRYKASIDPNNWDVQESKIRVQIATLFYKSIWFWTLIIAFALALLLYQYRYRINKEKQLFLLENKAQFLEQEKTRVMYESLKQQLNPHFLFNSLTSLSGLIETDQRMAANFLDRMSKIYRYILKNRNSELVSLGEEIEFVKLYINLQTTRFKKGLEVSIDVDEEKLQSKIAPVTLQNMVENAIKHNIIDIDSPLKVEIYVEDDYLVIRNNLQKKEMVETSNRLGLVSLQNLYLYLTSTPILIEQDELFFIIKIPLIND